jgi:hypothetical protein
MEATDHTHSENGSEQSPWGAHEAAQHLTEHPEAPVLAALVGGFLLAKLIGAFGGGDD